MKITKREPIYWAGSPITTCEVCNVHIQNIFIDGKTTRGPWVIMCPYCHARLGRGLGLGYGREYHKQPDGRWLQVL